MMKITAVIPAAGSGTRYNSVKNKLSEDLNGMPVIVCTLEKIAAVEEINNIIICASSDLIDEIRQLIRDYNIPKVEKVVTGGKTRQESVFIALKEAEGFNPDYVLIHDGARPLITGAIIKNAINTAVEKGASVVAVPVKDTIKRADCETGKVTETLKREELWSVQTPQIFKFKEIFEAHKTLKGRDFTDDAALAEELNIPVYITPGSYKNIKITTEEDVLVARMLIKYSS